eukprot:3677570-Rhodomonas_salina.1
MPPEVRAAARDMCHANWDWAPMAERLCELKVRAGGRRGRRGGALMRRGREGEREHVSSRVVEGDGERAGV